MPPKRQPILKKPTKPSRASLPLQKQEVKLDFDVSEHREPPKFSIYTYLPDYKPREDDFDDSVDSRSNSKSVTERNAGSSTRNVLPVMDDEPDKDEKVTAPFPLTVGDANLHADPSAGKHENVFDTAEATLSNETELLSLADIQRRLSLDPTNDFNYVQATPSNEQADFVDSSRPTQRGINTGSPTSACLHIEGASTTGSVAGSGSVTRSLIRSVAGSQRSELQDRLLKGQQLNEDELREVVKEWNKDILEAGHSQVCAICIPHRRIGSYLSPPLPFKRS